MGKLNVKNGTPVGNAHLCERCSWGQYIRGYRESDRLVICTNTNQNIVVPFTVLDCTSFNDKHLPDWKQMEKLAIDVNTVRVSAKTAGFSVGTKTRPTRTPDVDDDVEDEAAINR
jgi:hypothetical protein